MTSSNLLTAEGIIKSYDGKNILGSVTIRVETGKITGLLGRNGSGKSTLLKAIFGIEPYEEGCIHLNSVQVKKQPYRVNGLLNYLPQKPFLPKNFTIATILKQFKLERKVILDHFPELEDDLNKSVIELSGGRERLWAALIIIFADTKFTLLDEPFTHIMPLHIEKLLSIIVSQKEKKGIIVTDHMYKYILGIYDHLFLMKEGKSIYIKNTDNLVLHGYIRELTSTL